MKLKSIKYFDKSINWRLERTEFKDLTLLVGASGVGKTQILNAILNLKRIANGSSQNGIEWNVEFSTVDDSIYRWKGSFENKGFEANFVNYSDEENKKNRPKIISENVFLNGKEVVKRDNKDIIFDGKKTVKLSQQESVINLLKEEELISPAYQGFSKIIHDDYSHTMKEFSIVYFKNILRRGVKNLTKKYQSLESIQNSGEETSVKLFLIYNNDRETFKKIKDLFSDIFPQVEDIKIELLKKDVKGIQPLFKDIPFIQLKEKGVKDWIHETNISSGMFRTLMHISELYLCAEGTVILIDEFENSLGINCIDELTEDLLNSRRKLQFIITSHHPYIINNISYENWKLVTRKAGTVRTHDAQEFNIGKSKHDAFIQLINLDEYKTGIE